MWTKSSRAASSIIQLKPLASRQLKIEDSKTITKYISIWGGGCRSEANFCKLVLSLHCEYQESAKVISFTASTSTYHLASPKNVF